jgi:hypothetical protein
VLAVVLIVTGLDSLSHTIGDPYLTHTASNWFSCRWSRDRAGKDTIMAIMRWALRILSLLGLLGLAAEAVLYLQVEALWFLVALFGDDPFQVVLVLAAVLGILASLYAGRRGQRGWTAGFVVLTVSSILGPSIGPVLAFLVADDPTLHAGVQEAFSPFVLVVVQLVRAALFVVALTYSLLPISQRARLQVTAPLT